MTGNWRPETPWGHQLPISTQLKICSTQETQAYFKMFLTQGDINDKHADIIGLVEGEDWISSYKRKVLQSKGRGN